MLKKRVEIMEHFLENERRDSYYLMDKNAMAEMDKYVSRYKDFINSSKTVRTVILNSIKILEENGFQKYSKKHQLTPGSKVYYINKDRSLFSAVIGQSSLSEGCNIIASHVDAPHLDVRPRPLMQENGLALLKTHYYGWVRKHQWHSLPLMLSGIVYLENGEKAIVSIGGDPNDPVFVIPDLLPHISEEQNELPLSEAYSGEKMNLYLASSPLPECEESKAVKIKALKLLHEKYGMCENDFVTADLEIVPANQARDVGLDRSLIGAYGHDDRVCCFAALEALVSLQQPKRTAVLVLPDKEEVGNNGISGACSQAIDYFFDLLCAPQGIHRYECYQKSFCLSGDVTSAFDPNFSEAFSEENTAKVNGGVAICKYTGFKGKEQASEASASLVSYALNLFRKNGIVWQSSEMGRIDLGGGGTVALEFANRGIDTLDVGVPLLGMHSPFEIVSKLDCYMLNKAYKVVYQE